MTETSRQRVLKAIRHEQPDITPTNLEGFYDTERWQKHFSTLDRIVIRDKLDTDIQSARPVYTGPLKGKDLSIWGTPMNIYGAGGVGYGAGRDYPLARVEKAEEVDDWPWPDPEDFDYAITAEVLQSIPGDRAKRLDGKYGVEKEGSSRAELTQSGAWVPLVCTLFDLFGIEGTLVRMHLEPRVIEAALRRLEDFLLGFFSRMLAKAGHAADLVYFGDDFSTQKGLMISPEQWRRFLLPTYRRLFSLIKGHGKYVWFHSCGSFHEVMGDLIDAGMDVWETVQVQAAGNDPRELKRKYGGNITFYGGISTQTTLPRGSPEDVRREVRDRISVLGEGGGYIVGADHGIMPDVPMENVLAMYDEAKHSGTRR
ncbi:MAG TPA: uroporphyrinogen decarboxylase family protein [Spirochaetia bacterium]|nr:uroporphyrinogen decarboxylase family protein [Spirochaetia bacterium]